MKHISKIFSVTSISLLLLISFNTNAAEKLVSQRVINSKGLKIKVKGKTFIVTKIINKKSPNKACSLSVRGLRFLSLNDMPMKGATAEMNLQAKIGSKGHPYCSGQGTGCVITIEVPDAEPASKLLN